MRSLLRAQALFIGIETVLFFKCGKLDCKYLVLTSGDRVEIGVINFHRPIYFGKVVLNIGFCGVMVVNGWVYFNIAQRVWADVIKNEFLRSASQLRRVIYLRNSGYCGQLSIDFIAYGLTLTNMQRSSSGG